jgi:purine-nucleoside phosphorylase
MKKTLVSYLGKHTTISHLTPKEWRKIPYLKDNGGFLPPFIIAVGDARRIKRANKILKMKNVVELHKVGEKMLGLNGRGRVDMIVGTYTHAGKSIPIVIMETQMGMPATEINVRELLAHCRKNYKHDKKTIKANGLYIIRAGSAGAIRPDDKNHEAFDISVGDIVNATFTVGMSGALLQSMAGLDFFSDDTLARFAGRWLKLGHSFTPDGRFPKAMMSEELIDAINRSAAELNVRSFPGGNFSKDSLYAENDIDAFVRLCRLYGIISTEMEQLAIAKLAAEFKTQGIDVHTGLVSGILGVMPDESFATGKKQCQKIERVESATLEVAARALWHVAYDR